MNPAPVVSDPALAANVAVVERWLACFDRRWPTAADLDELLTEDVRFLERPNLFAPDGGERGRDGMQAGIAAAHGLLSWQRFEVLGHVAAGDVVVTRMRWSLELAIDVGALAAGTRCAAWCVAHYRLRDGRIAHIEQHDC